MLPQNISQQLPGMIGPTRESVTELDCRFNFFMDAIIQKIVLYTNQYTAYIQLRFTRSWDVKIFDLNDMKAFIGILYLLSQIGNIWKRFGLMMASVLNNVG